MSRQPKRGYFVKGQFVATGSELDAELVRERKGHTTVSKTDLKQASHDLQKLGTDLLDLSAALLDKIDLPDRVRLAIDQANSITAFEGKRRQLQYVGKLMRTLDEETLVRARSALDEQHRPNAETTQRLHEAENWRLRLLDQDLAMNDWLLAYPDTDVQHVRALIRQARKDAKPDPHRGQALRHAHAYRELFQVINDQIKRQSVEQKINQSDD
jgi:ribosome-associated protein